MRYLTSYKLSDRLSYMLIDIRQLISLTKLRQQTATTLGQVKQGQKFWISDRGKVVAVLSPVEKPTISREEAFKKIQQLQKRMDQAGNRSKGKIWNSTEAIRKMRDERSKKLLSYWKD